MVWLNLKLVKAPTDNWVLIAHKFRTTQKTCGRAKGCIYASCISILCLQKIAYKTVSPFQKKYIFSSMSVDKMLLLNPDLLEQDKIIINRTHLWLCLGCLIKKLKSTQKKIKIRNKKNQGPFLTPGKWSTATLLIGSPPVANCLCANYIALLPKSLLVPPWP